MAEFDPNQLNRRASKFKPASRRQAVIIIAIIILLVVGFLVLKNSNSTTKPKQSTTQSTIAYPSGWAEATVAANDKKKGVLLAARHNDPTASLVVRSITGKLAKDFDIKTLPDQVEKNFKNKLTDFSLVSKEIKKVGSDDSVQLRYKFVNNNKTYESLIIIVPTADETFYLTFSTLEGAFDKIASEATQISEAFMRYANSR